MRQKNSLSLSVVGCLLCDCAYQRSWIVVEMISLAAFSTISLVLPIYPCMWSLKRVLRRFFSLFFIIINISLFCFVFTLSFPSIITFFFLIYILDFLFFRSIETTPQRDTNSIKKQQQQQTVVIFCFYIKMNSSGN